MDKADYILRMMTKVSKKRWEYFVVSRIIHGLKDFEIEFVTQQLVRRPDGKRALTDMYFPQFGIHLEIDEAQHETEAHKLADKRRDEDIVSVTEHQIYRLRASNSLEQLANDTDAFIRKIMDLKDEMKSKNSFVSWDLDKRYNPESYRDLDSIKVNQNVLFKRQADALRLFGYKGGNYQRGAWSLSDGSGDFVWFPRLYETDDWNNELSPCGAVIIERAISEKAKNNTTVSKHHYREDINRIVFAKAKDVLGHALYRYVGTFKLNTSRSKHGITYFDLNKSEQEICLPPEGSYEKLQDKKAGLKSSLEHM